MFAQAASVVFSNEDRIGIHAMDLNGQFFWPKGAGVGSRAGALDKASAGGAGRGRLRADLPAAYAPALNLAEWVFEHIRARIESRVYASLEDKIARVEQVLQALNADPYALHCMAAWE